MSRLRSVLTGNLLIDALTDSDALSLGPHLEPTHLERGAVLVTANEPITHVYFPQSGVASITSTSTDSGRTEVGIFGRDGMSATCLLLGGEQSPHDSFIQVGPGNALRIQAELLVEIVGQHPGMRQLLLRYVQTQIVQVAQCAVANARLAMEARLARWLLMCHDRVDGDEIALTHEFMAVMIAAQRSGVTLALHILEGTGMIRSSRGLVVIRDRGKLEALVGDSYGIAETTYRRLIGPLRQTTSVSH